MNTEARQNREWLQEGAQVLAVHTGESSPGRQWVERVTINVIDGDMVITNDYAEYSIGDIEVGPGKHFASMAVLVPLDDPEARTMLFLEEQRKAQEAIVNAELAVARKPNSTVARRRLGAAIVASDHIKMEFGAFMTAVPADA